MVVQMVVPPTILAENGQFEIYFREKANILKQKSNSDLFVPSN